MNSMPVESLPIVQEDVNQALIYIAADNPAATDALLSASLAALEQVFCFSYSGTEVTTGSRRSRHY